MSSRKILDIRKKAPQSRAKARVHMTSIFPQKARLKTRRRAKRILALCVCVVCAVGAVGSLAAASHAEKFAIKNITVSGTQALSSSELSAAAAAGLQDSSFKLFASKISVFLSNSTLLPLPQLPPPHL